MTVKTIVYASSRSLIVTPVDSASLTSIIHVDKIEIETSSTGESEHIYLYKKEQDGDFIYIGLARKDCVPCIPN